MGNPKQNIRRGKVIAQRYSMVKISHAEPGYTRSQMWSKRQGQSGRGRRLEDKKKEQIRKKSVQQMVRNSNTKQKRGGANVVVQCYSMAILPSAEQNQGT
jgi:hypothetical protein